MFWATKKLRQTGRCNRLTGVLHIYEKDGETHAKYWSTTPIQNTLADLAERYFSRQATSTYLQSGGLTRGGFNDARRKSISVNSFNPAKGQNRCGRTSGNWQRPRSIFCRCCPVYGALVCGVYGGIYVIDVHGRGEDQ